MNTSVGWFVMMAALTLLAWCVGQHLGRARGRRGYLALALGLALLAQWAWLVHHPSVAVRLAPAWIFRYIQGTGAAPAFMLIIGIAGAMCRLPRQKRLVMLGGVLGVVYFLQGGMWMLQATPAVGFAHTVHRGLVRQSQDYSCVPAACATALNTLGVYTSEDEMARLTQTRPGTGATTVRALYGLNQRLADTPWRAELVGLDASQLQGAPMPAVTPMRFESTRRHMVAILHADVGGVRVADPAVGVDTYDWSIFTRHYTGDVLVFVRRP